jgi:hypothetical protein
MNKEPRVTAFTKAFFEPKILGIGRIEELDQFLARVDFPDDDTEYTGESSMKSFFDGTYNI